jgi:hypothetical protein
VHPILWISLASLLGDSFSQCEKTSILSKLRGDVSQNSAGTSSGRLWRSAAFELPILSPRELQMRRSCSLIPLWESNARQRTGHGCETRARSYRNIFSCVIYCFSPEMSFPSPPKIVSLGMAGNSSQGANNEVSRRDSGLVLYPELYGSVQQ